MNYESDQTEQNVETQKWIVDIKAKKKSGPFCLGRKADKNKNRVSF